MPRKVQIFSVSWKRLPRMQYKLNIDASVGNGRACRDGVLHGSDGRLIFAFYKEFGEFDVLQVES